MSFTSTALKNAVDRSGRDQVYWAKQIGMDVSQFNKYCNGRVGVSQPVLTKILDTFPSYLRASILQGYLHDQMPEKHKHLIQIYALEGKVAEPAPDLFEGLTERQRSNLLCLAERMQRSKAVEELVDKMVRALRGE